VLTIVSIVVIVIYLIYLKFNIYNHQVGLLLPWLLIIIFSFFELSSLHVSINESTIYTIVSFLFFYVLGSKMAYSRKKAIHDANLNMVIYVSVRRFFTVLIVFLVFTLLNIVLAGYIPLISMLTTGDSRYLDFGITGIYGFYLAFANALGVLAYYLYNKTNRKLYLNTVILIFMIFVLFVTRQNIISLLVELFILHGYINRFIDLKKVFLLVIVVLLLFSYIGELRSGDIKEIIEANEKYLWLPSFIFWMYGYFYFSGLNLNNMINNTSAPYFDGSSFMAIVPNFVKNLIGYSVDHEYFLQKINFNVSTALTPIYSDMGMYEVISIGLLTGVLTSYLYKKIKTKIDDFKYLSIYSVLFFCAMFSFFVNFWFYLPIIFQIPFYIFFNKYIFRKRIMTNE
jgi:oligosaccharide repeat unit polymerase